MKFRHLIPLACAAALLGACNSGAEETTVDEVAAPAPELTTAPTPTAAPDGTALVPGSWTVAEDARGARASYAADGADPSLTIACDTASSAVTLSLVTVSDAPASYVVEAGGEAARLDMVPADGKVSAEIEPSLPIFAAFSAPTTAIALTPPEGEKMQFPTHAGLRRVMDACS